MKKSIVCIVIVFFLLCLLQIVPIQAKAETLTSGDCGDSAEWDFDAATGVLTISGSGDIYDYKASQSPWFEHTSKIKKIVIQSGITGIGNDAFSGCSQAASVSFPDSLKWIGSQAFFNCWTLTQLDLPSNVREIGNYAFEYCSGLKKVVLPESITACGKGAFRNCRNLVEVVLPSGWKEIPAEMFCNSGLAQITIPAGIEKIGYRAFETCSGLMLIQFKGNAPTFENRVFTNVKAAVSYPASNATWTADVLQNYDGTLTWYPDNGSGPQVFGTYVNLDWEMKGNTLYITQNPNLQSGHYPSHPEWLAYRGLIEKVVMSGKIETVGFSFFEGCVKLKEIQWPTGLKHINDNAFKGCIALESITFPDSLENIGGTVFALCKNLKTVVLPKNLYSLDYRVFKNCTGLESITIPAGVGEMGRSVFEGCTSLKTIYFTSYMPKFMTVERTPASVIRPGVIQPAAYEPGTFSQIGSAVTVYYLEGELTWTVGALQNLKEQYADENITFASYQLKTEEPDTTQTESNPTISTDPSQPVPTESAPTQETTQSTIPATEGSAVATEPSGSSEDADNTKNALIFVGAGIVLLGLAAFGIFFLKPRFARSKQE